MRPRNKFERRIEQLSKTLAPICKKHREQAVEKCFEHEAWKSGKRCFCTECGHEFATHESDTVTVCPSCGRTITIKKTRRKNLRDIKYFAVMTTCQEFQVIRYLEAVKSIHLTWKPENRILYGVTEVCRYWIDGSGKSCWQARCCFNMFYRKNWRYDTPITLKEHCHDFYCQGVYAPQRVIPELKRNGFRFDFHEEAPATCFASLLRHSQYETLWKAGYYKFLAQTRGIDQVKDNFGALKVCIRHGYIPDDAGIWYDLMRNLNRLGRDTHNPHYICPKDLKAAHDESVRQVEILRQREAEERRRESLRNDMVEFSKKRVYFGICFGNDKFKVTVLKSLQEYDEEGKAMHHCVFTNRYYADKDSLILSAKDSDGNRLATIEMSLKNYKVLQCRAVCNKKPEQYDEIVRLVESHARDFRKAKRQLQTA